MANGRPGGIAMAGDVLAGKYALIQLLGRGGMGAVFSAENRWTGRRVAVKVLHGEAARMPEAVTRFMQEARITTHLAHPNIVEVLDAGQEPDGPMFIVQELLEGQDLRKRLDAPPPMDLREALDVIVPIMGALAAAHRHGVVHRDIKPENIFLSRAASDGRMVPKLIDFGLSKMLDTSKKAALTMRGAVLGTPAYMSPEQARGAANVDTRTDIWAIGAVLFEMLAGRAPVEDRHPNLVLLRLATLTEALDLGPVAPRVPADVAAAVRRALEPDMAQRWATMQDFLQAILQGRGPGGAPLGDAIVARHRASLPWLSAHATAAVTAAAALQRPSIPTRRGKPDSIPDLSFDAHESIDPSIGALDPTDSNAPVAGSVEPLVDDGPTIATPDLAATVAAAIAAARRSEVSIPAVQSAAPPEAPVHYSLDPRITETLGWCEHFLDTHPTDLRPFERIRKILVKHADHDELAFAYRKQIARTQALGTLPVEPMLWTELARLYRERLGDAARADEATEQARLAAARQPARALAQCRAALHRAPDDADALAALFDLLVESNQIDRAFCVASTAVFVHRDRTRRDVLEFHQRHLPPDLPVPRARLPRERWGSDLWPTSIDPLVARVFACILPALHPTPPKPPSASGLHEPAREEPGSPAGRVLQALALATAAFNVPEPLRVYFRPDAGEGLAYVASEPPASIVGGRFLRAITVAEARALAARHVTYYQPDFYARVLRPSRIELGAYLSAALSLGDAAFEPMGSGEAITLARAVIERTLADDHDRWSELRCAASLLTEARREPDLAGWYEGIEHAACRAGFALSGSLAAARRMIALGDGSPGDAPAEDRFRDVLRYSVSEQYFRLREGLALRM